MADLEANDIVTSIVNGDQDTALVDIGNAIKSRIDGDHVRPRWWVQFAERVITADVCNVNAALSFERQTQVPWDDAEPGRSVTQRAALVIGYLIEVEGMVGKDAFELLKQQPAGAITFGEYAQVNPPKDGSPSED